MWLQNTAMNNVVMVYWTTELEPYYRTISVTTNVTNESTKLEPYSRTISVTTNVANESTKLEPYSRTISITIITNVTKNLCNNLE